MNKRLKEILERKAEIRTSLQSEEEVDVKALQEEVRTLTEEQEKIEERQRIAEGITNGGIEGRKIPKPKDTRDNVPFNALRDLKWDEAIETDEYRTAWAKDMMGQTISAEERSLMDRVNEEYREFTHTTENTQILVPKTVTDGIWKRAEEQSALWTAVRKMRVKGELTMLKGNTSADARWYDEDDIVDTDELGFGQLNLFGCELAKAIQVSWKLRKMAVAQFEAYIQEEIGVRMGKSLANGVYVGRGKPGEGDNFKPEPTGVRTALFAEEGTPGVVSYTDAPTYGDFTAVLGGLNSAYANGTVIYANNKTIWSLLANMHDANERPYFVADVQAGGVGRIFGLSVRADAAIPDGEILVANLGQGYVANINEDITMYREEHVRQRLTDYMGYAIVDGAPLDNRAFTVLVPEAPTV